MWGPLGHSFVAVQLLPQSTAAVRVHSCTVQGAAGLLTTPFLALRVRLSDIHRNVSHPGENKKRALFLVSSDKPTGDNRHCYFSLRAASPATPQSSGRTLVVHPALPFRREQLYLHTCPMIAEHRTCPLSDDGPSVPGHLDEAGMNLLCDAFISDGRARIAITKAESTVRWSGGPEPVLEDWDTWSSGRRGSFGLQFSSAEYILQYAPPGDAAVDKPSIIDELRLLTQYGRDHAWAGCSNVLSWVQRRREASRLVFYRRHDASHVTQDEDWRYLAIELSKIPIPYDGDPQPELSDDEIYDWDDEPMQEFPRIFSHRPAIPVKDVKIIIFDVFSTVFDRMPGIQEALQLLAGGKLLASQLARLSIRYLECEVLRGSTPGSRCDDTARAALQDMARFLGLTASPNLLDEALKIMLCPRVFPDVVSTMKTFHEDGYTLVGFVSMDEPTFSRYYEGHLPPELSLYVKSPDSSRLWNQDASLFSDILDVVKRHTTDTVALDNMLLVTNNKFRVVEPALVAGFPTALICREGDLESHVVVPDGLNPPPSLVASDLVELGEQLRDLPPLPTRSQHPAENACRIKDHYHMVGTLGTGSFGAVGEAKHLLTGECVAIKTELSFEVEGRKPVLLYEAQIYRLLYGIPGIPSVRWSGAYSNANIMIMDKLGPTIDQLHKLCRSQFSRRTVLMLADQMLQRLEDIHDRGIILRDIKPDNFAMGLEPETEGIVHTFDFGFCKLYLEPTTGKHIPFREGRDGPGSVRYSSYNFHLGREQSRRDDLESLGNTLLYLLHGRLPWQGIYAADIPAKLKRIGEMKAGQQFRDFLARSPPEFTEYFDHVRGLAFDARPDYALLRATFRKQMQKEGWEYDERAFDWMDPKDVEKGTLIPGEYNFDMKFVEVDVI